MSCRIGFAAKAVLVASGLAAGLQLASCRDPARPSGSDAGLPAEYLGRWYFRGTSGGIEGRQVAAADGSWIELTAGDTLERYSPEGRLVSTEAFEPARGRSIFSGTDAWILGGAVTTPRVLQILPEGALTISDNVYDGFSSTYTRDR